jgi:flagellar basal-body rod protein FlgC
MVDPLETAIRVAGSGLAAQSVRLRVTAENVANANSTGDTPGATPYSRKTITFASELDRVLGASLIGVDNIGKDSKPFRVEYDPGHPAADENGYVKLPNVNILVEMADMRDATRAYEADLQMIRQARELIAMTIDLLRTNG